MRILFILLILFSSQAWATDYYVDCTSGSNGNSGLSDSLPKLTITAAVTLAVDSDTIYVKGGTTCNEQVTVIGTDSLSIKNWPTDPDTDAGKYIIDAQNTRDYGILISTTGTSDATDTDNITVEDAEIKNAVKVPLAVIVTGSSANGTGYDITRVTAHDAGPAEVIGAESTYAAGNCFWARVEVNGTAILNDITYTDTVAYNCAKHGYATRFNVTNATYIRAIAHHTGLTASGQGFTANPMFSSFNMSGWTDADGGGAGTIYYRDRPSAVEDTQRMADFTASMLLTEETATPLTPGVGEWSDVEEGAGGACAGAATVGCHYINTGGNANDKLIIVKRFPHGPFYYYDCEVYNINDFVAGEGHGFDMDDLAGPGYYYRNYAHDNAGSGFTTLKGERNTWIGNVSEGNVGAGFNINACTGCALINNTANANSRGFYDGGITSENVDVINNLATNNTTQGFTYTAGTAGASGSSSATNQSFGNATNTCANTTCSLTTDPGYAGGTSPTTKAGFRISSRGTGRRAGTDLNIGNVQDAGNRAFHHPPSIGAWEAASGDTAATRPLR